MAVTVPHIVFLTRTNVITTRTTEISFRFQIQSAISTRRVYFYTQSVISTHTSLGLTQMSVIKTLTSVITTHANVINTRRVQFPHAEGDYYTQSVFYTHSLIAQIAISTKKKC
jgi:hypothetical protein